MDEAAQVKDLAFLYSIYNEYSFSAQFTEITKDFSDTLPGESEVNNIKSIIDQEKEHLSKLSSQIDKISPLIDSTIATELRFMIDQCLKSLDTIGVNLDYFSSDMSIENWNAVIKAFNVDYLSRAGMLEEVVAKTEPLFAESIVEATQHNQLTKEDLDEILRMPNLSEEQKNIVRETRERMDEMQIEQADTNGNEGKQETVEEQKGERSIAPAATQERRVAPAVVTEVQVADPVRQSLEERLNGITYHQGMVYADAVSQVRTDYEVERLDKRIAALEAKREKSKKGKLSFKDAVELQQLINQKEMLQEAEYNLSRRERRVEDRLARTDERSTARKDAIAEEQAKQAEAKSRLFKHISARKEQKLQEKLLKLQQKMTTMSMQQRTAALIKFDKMNNRIAKQARKDAKKQVRQERHQQRVEAFNNFRNDVVAEAQAVRRDAERFISHPVAERCAQLREKIVALKGTPTQTGLGTNVNLEEASLGI